VRELAKSGVEQIYYCDPCDNWLEKRLKEASNKNGIVLKCFPSPNFICSSEYIEQYFNEEKFFLTSFYIEQRKRLDIMIENGKPLGGKWTYDSDNRRKMPALVRPPQLPVQDENNYVKEAINYVNTYFPENHGNLKKFIYPVTFSDSYLWLESFLEMRFQNYGIYQDAIVSEENFLFHSVLTPMLNIGLLQPLYVLERAIKFALNNHIPVNSLEGFVRQILGWREYIRAVYVLKGSEQRTTNFWGHQRKIPNSFYKAETGIIPIDACIKRLLQYGYNHHIERLMILGNFMCLCEFSPDEIYRWFMELYIDAYDWVMVPNVYGMSQFADGGLMSTKPYISSSNYVLKMSNHTRGSWCDIWDALYWRFVYTHRAFFESNPRMSVMTKQLDKSGNKIAEHLKRADAFLRKLDAIVQPA
ncbi:MAG: cryptochrome/photolyase family protein, partial [Chitinophagales bacterium]|nr:cryptochrome/photolyase family protein [Chitinophagales bacterium]